MFFSWLRLLLQRTRSRANLLRARKLSRWGRRYQFNWDLLEDRTLLSVTFIPGAYTVPAVNRTDIPLGTYGGGVPIEPFLSVNGVDPGNIAVSSQGRLRLTSNAGGTFTGNIAFTNPPGDDNHDGDTSTAYDAAGRLFWSKLDGVGSLGVAIDQVNPTTGADISTSSAGNNDDDKEFLAADTNPASPFVNNLYVIWTRFGVNPAEVFISHSTDHAVTWSTPLQLSTSSESFVWPASVAVAPNGDVYAAYHSQPGSLNPTTGTSGLTYVLRSTDGGVTFPQKTQAFTAGQSDISYNVQTDTSGKFPNTQFWTQGSAEPYVLPDPVRPGNIYVIAVDDPDNVHGSGDDADVVIARSTNNGQTWTRATVSSGPASSFQLFPTAAIDKFGDIVVAWYDNRRGLTNSSGRYLLDVYATYSTDGGLTWAPEFMINDPSNPFDPDPGAVNRFAGPPPTKRIGEYFGLSLFGGTAYAAWNGNTFSGGVPVSQQVTFDAFPINGSLTVNGDDAGPNTDDVITVSAIAGNSGFVEVIVNGQRQYAGLLAALSGGISVNSGGGHDTLRADFGNGNPIPPGGLTFNGSPVTTPPVANGDSYAIDEDTTLSVAVAGVLANDTDPGNAALVTLLSSAPAHGTLTLNADGSFAYVPSANFNGGDSFSYQVDNGQAYSAIATVSIIVNPVPDVPVAHNDTYTLARNASLNVPPFGVLENDIELDARDMRAVLVQNVGHGTLSLLSDGSLNYTPVFNYVGTDSFTYKINDGLFDSNVATVSLVTRARTPALLADINTIASSASPTSMVDVNGLLFFAATNSNLGTELWEFQGTESRPVADIQLGAGSSAPTSLVNVNGTLFFVANDGAGTGQHGSELWRSDGTSAGTVLVQDVQPGASSAGFLSLVNVNGTLFFAVNDGTTTGQHGTELWRSDGTSAGTTLVADINDGTASAGIVSLTNAGGTLFFGASDGTDTGGEEGGTDAGQHGTELWRSDGTSAGTMLVADIQDGTTSSDVQSLVNVSGTLFFAANDGTSGTELWSSDGTSSGTTLVADIMAGIGSSAPASLTNLSGTLLFVADNGTTGSELWTSNGSSAGTLLVADIQSGINGGITNGSLTNVNGTLFFRGNDGVTGTELWRSDGSLAGTTLVKDILNQGVTSAGITTLANVSGTLFFAANDGTTPGQHGTELWRSDGTCAGTTLVADIRPGTSSAGLTTLTNIHGSLFFVGNDGAAAGQHGSELWRSDGSSAGTTLIRDIFPGDQSGLVDSLTVVSGTLFFIANDGVVGNELRRSDGTSQGTQLVVDIRPGTNGSGVTRLTELNGTLFFVANDGNTGSELWRSNGSSAGTTLVSDIQFGAVGAAPNSLTNVNGTLFFTANDGASTVAPLGHGNELWRSNGTSGGTTLVKDIRTGTTTSSPSSLTNVNGTLMFTANDGTSTVAPLGHGTELWRSNGTSAGTTLVKDIRTGTTASAPSSLTNVNGTLMFAANDGGNFTELWRSNGTSSGTTLVRNINPSFGSYPASLTSVNGTLFFSATDNIAGTELWKSNGTLAGTTLVRDILAGTDDSNPTALVNVNGTLFFAADDGVTNTELWKSDGSCAGTVLLRDIFSGSNGSGASSLTNINGTLFFRANDGSTGTELWLSDATSAGTMLVRDIFPGSGSGTPVSLVSLGNAIAFAASDGFSLTELWLFQPNDVPPVANRDSFAIDEDVTLSVTSAGVLSNDTDVEGDPITATLLSAPAHGLVTLQSNGAFTYVNMQDFNGTDSFTYVANDGTLDSNMATVTIVVNAVNDAPLANNDNYSVFEDQTLAVAATGVLGNDTDVDPGTGQPETLTAILAIGTLHGNLVLHADGSFTYQGNANFNGTDAFTYVANDGSLNSATASVIITVIPVNDPPVAANDLYSVFEDQSLAVGAPGVLGNDFDIDSPTLTALLVNPTQHGTLTLNADGSLAYFANADYNGTDSFTYKANDGSLNSDPATVSIVVVSVNDPPVAGDDAYSVFENQTLSVAAAGVLGNDNDIDSPSLTAVLSSGPARGVLTFNADGSFSYTPGVNYSGTDSFTYRANDGLLGSNLATVSVTMVRVNQAPVAGDDALSVFENQTLVVGAAGVLTNDSDVDSPTLTALLVTGPVHGTLTLNSDGSLTYVPNVNYSGTDSFTYKANDGLLNSNLATVSINVDPVNQAPTANNDAYSLFEDFTLTKTAPGALANDTDVDSPVLTTNLVAGPAHGTLSFNTNGAFTYVPGLHYFGTDSFTYKANDGLLNSDIATVKITVIAVNHAPTANRDSYSVFEDSSLSVGTPGVLNNDSDIDGNSLTSILLAGAAHGTLTLRSNGAFTYTPATHYSGGDSFTYRANDGSLNSTAATVTLNVIFVNHAPTANGDSYTVQGDTTLTVAVASGVLANDTDVENSVLSAILSANPAHGTVTLNSNGSFTYTPSSGFVGTDSFRYRANDGSANSTQATVTLTVQAPGPVAPSAADVSDLVRADASALTDNHDGTFTGTITITNITSDSDIDGPLQVVLTNLTSSVTLQNKTGDTPAGNPYITISAGSLTANKLAPGQSTVVTVVFDDPLALSISYVTRTLSGTI